MSEKLFVVTASIDPEKTRDFWGTWAPLSALEAPIVMVVNSPEAVEILGPQPPLAFRIPRVLGPVVAFAAGIEFAIEQGATLIACLHDDLALMDYGWDRRVVEHFEKRRACQLAGFSGADGLGALDIYRATSLRYECCKAQCVGDYLHCPEHGGDPEKDYSKLARQGFFSNMVDAEKHGRRELLPRVSACADGFSQIGRPGFLQAAFNHFKAREVKHHAYDSWLGMLAWRWGGECWYLPERCAHAGGRTAVLAPEYHTWAEKLGGDGGIWKHAHREFWEDGKGFLPFRVGEGERG